MKNIVNLILFQLLWVSCIFGVAKSQMIPAIVVMGLMFLMYIIPKFRQTTDTILLVACLCLGFVLDSILAHQNLIDYFYDLGYQSIAPFWIMMLWAGFALTLNHSMSWLFKHPKLAYFFMAIGPVLSYFSASRIGAVSIESMALTFPVVAILWIVTFSILNKLQNFSIKRAHYAY